ncbi:MAG TPA: phytanoyl-CoA dioxygenase family protein [Abditibacteriaceae bacterium]|nr:phytanoyl-CoA dioxygenase family protein [Abditibacteriaceae bacterium]
MNASISVAQWERYERDGYLILGKLLSDEEVATLQKRLDDIMLGKAPVDYNRMVMQREGESGQYNQQGIQDKGFKGATLNYRVVYALEYDPLFLEYIQRPIFHEICQRVYGPETGIATYRAFVMNKPARGGSDLHWHQDRWTFLDRDPLITVWTALDAATVENGCLQIIKGSHRAGVINPSAESGSITPEQAAQHCPAARIVHIELRPGEVALLHNWLLHASAINHTDAPRRGFSTCYMDARTQDTRPLEDRTHLYEPTAYPLIFGAGALDPAALSGSSVRSAS